MDEELEKIIQEQSKKLPQEVQDAIASFDWHDKVLEIGTKHSLHINQMGDLETETILALLGLTPPHLYLTQIKTRLGLPEEKAAAIVTDANELIFNPIRAKLKEFYETRVKREEKELPWEETEEEALSTLVASPTTLEKGEKSVLQKLGVEMVEEKKISDTEQHITKIREEEKGFMKKAGVEMEPKEPFPKEAPGVVKQPRLRKQDIKELVKKDETPPPEPVKENIAEKKLGGIFKMPVQKTDPYKEMGKEDPYKEKPK